MGITKDLTDCEKLIMQIVWDNLDDLTLQELTAELQNRFCKEYARTTVVTFIQRLQKKEYVQAYRKGRFSYIHPIVEKTEYLKYYFGSILEFWFEGNLDAMLQVVDDEVARENLIELLANAKSA